MSDGRRIKLFRNEEGDWWWHVLAANGSDKLYGSLQGYSRRKDALAIIADLPDDMPIDIEIEPPGDAAPDPAV